MEQNHTRFTPEAATDEPASLVLQPGETETGSFEPVPVRYRRDGWTPEKQREFVEVLADTGLIREAAARVGMTEQSVSRLRRRSDVRAFDLACEVAVRPGARRLHSIAWERAIEGTMKRHYYHGELKAEERVYDNRLLVYLLGKTQGLVDPPQSAQQLLGDWETLMEVIEQELPVEPGQVPCRAFNRQIWESQGRLWTRFPPPAGFDGIQCGAFGEPAYRRTLSEAEEAGILDDTPDETEARAARDRYFGFEGGTFSSPGEPNL